MIRIAICDDVRCYTEVLNVMIRHWAQKRKLNVELEVFTSGEELLCSVEEKGSFLAAFMDIELTGINGIETAKKLRKENKYTSIVFISQYDNYFKQMFEIYPCYYIGKPVPEKKLLEILDRIMEEHRYIYAIYPFRFQKKNYNVFLRKVLYFCSEKRKIRIVTEDNEDYVFYKKLDMVEKQIEDYDVKFLRIHKSYLVNSRQVELFCADSVKMSNGEVLAVSRKHRENMNRFHRESFL